ncbi:hypothetical protein BGW36DRAFT_430076 [Talaromyces proteolyticus]|uniref:Zn(2)-C6 fungal-type domain-containing protein n=1 Tax=Talaromyces proteolyticus TaxID=1131652 RepID=A0AAD4KRL8_9EURO|nr:uncharacterized protein BGW36DRAFT_430076 [Talaromyces proteolyticus]KAH8694052.1 hypothetical protein BGW36DRAFT_430076 [Talaromyces proteolyticus]
MSHAGHNSHTHSRGNKLGYYRASVACNYCRKRKARCVPSANDYKGRCVNCTRLDRPCVAVTVAAMRALDGSGTDTSSVTDGRLTTTHESVPGISDARSLESSHFTSRQLLPQTEPRSHEEIPHQPGTCDQMTNWVIIDPSRAYTEQLVTEIWSDNPKQSSMSSLNAMASSDNNFLSQSHLLPYKEPDAYFDDETNYGVFSNDHVNPDNRLLFDPLVYGMPPDVTSYRDYGFIPENNPTWNDFGHDLEHQLQPDGSLNAFSHPDSSYLFSLNSALQSQ